MAGIDDNQPEQKSNNQPENTNAATNSQKNSKLDVVTRSLTVNIFFDGTLNNMYNSDLRTKANPTAKDIALQNTLVQPKTSYVNDLSNVALLFKACSKSENVVEKIYIQGSGTTMYEEDSMGGYAFSLGKTGVYTRVSEALDKLTKAIIQAKLQGSIEVTANVFGFSRGSFFARYFCAELAKANEDIQINFVGHYDTDEIYWEWFKEKGYYSGNPQSENLHEKGNFVLKAVENSDALKSLNFIDLVYARRNVPYKDYQFILANGMKKIAEKEGLKFNGTEKNILEKGIAEMQNCSLILQILDQYVCQYLLDHYTESGFHEIELAQAGLSSEQQKQLYHYYIHNSLTPGDIIHGKGGLYNQTNPPKRAEINDNA